MSQTPPDPAAADYLEPYRQEVKAHGAGTNATLWASARSQEIRFAAIAGAIELTGRRVLDAGCGPGDFADWLLRHGFQYESFVGVDGVPEVVQTAVTRKLARSRWVHADLLRSAEAMNQARPEIITMSGTLNTMDLDTAVQLLENCWAAASHALVFNFLCTTHGSDAPPQEYPANRLDTHRLLDWAATKTWAVSYHQDYFPNAHDGMIVMTRK